MNEAFGRIKERKLFQWAIAYVAGGWLLLELLGFVADNFGWPASLIRVATVLLGVGFFATLVLAWYHGEKGHQRVGGVELLMLAALLLIAGIAVRFALGFHETEDDSIETVLAPPLGADAVDRASIAILPFENQSADPANEYFSDGITDDIITQLAQIEELKVISKTSVMRYRERADKSLRDIAEELSVAAILEGGVRRAGDRVRITAQLVDARTDRHLWAQTYDQELTAENIFAIQSDVALAIAQSLRATLAPEVTRRIERAPTTSLEAYDLYARGRYLWGQQTRESIEASVALYRQAIGLDSTYALAYAGLSNSYAALWALFYLPEADALPLARSAAEAAVRWGPELAAGYSSLGFVLQSEMRWKEARAAYERALDLDPGDAQSRQMHALLLLNLGFTEEALAEMRRAVQLDPLSVQSRTAYATLFLFAREYEAAIEEASNILEFEPELDYLHYVLGFAHAMLGDLETALAALERANEINGNAGYSRVGLAYLHAMAGRREEALAILAELEGGLVPYREIALVYGVLGDLNRAFENLDRALEEQPASLGFITTDPTADPLRDDPRYDALLGKLGVK